MSELFRRFLERGGDDRSLCEEDYEKLGGVGGSLRNRADDVYLGLPDDTHRATMRRVMLRMVSVQGGELARRRVPDQELVYEDTEENRRVEEIVSRLTEARLVVEGNEIDDQPFVEPAHDELIKGWDKLFRWSREESENLQLLRRLTPASTAWESGQGGLWLRDPRLGLLKQVLRSDAGWLNRLEATFVWRSFSARRRIVLAAATVLTLSFALISGLGLVARDQRGRAVSALAETEKTLAKSLLSVLGLSGESPSVMEIESLWQLATLPSDNENVRLLFLKRALESGTTARQLRNRADQAVHAAVQLDEGRRDRMVREIVMPTLKAPPDMGTDSASAKEIRLTCALVGMQLGMLDEDSVDSREFARHSFEAALDSFYGTTNFHPDQFALLERSAARLASADAVVAISKVEKRLDQKQHTTEPIDLAAEPARKAVIPRLEAMDRLKVLKSLVTRTTDRTPSSGFRTQVMVAIAAHGLEPKMAAELTQPLLDQIGSGIELQRSMGNLDVLLALAPYWDEATATKAVPGVRSYTSAYVADILRGIRKAPGNPRAGWGGALSFLNIAASDLPWNVPSNDLKAAAVALIEEFLRSPGMPLEDFHSTCSRGILAMARWMDRGDRSSLVESIRSTLARGKFEEESARKELVALLAKLQVLPQTSADTSREFPAAVRSAWSHIFFTAPPKTLPTRPQPSSRPTPLSSRYLKNTPDPVDPEAAARAIIDYLKKPQPDNMYDPGPALGTAATLQRIGPKLSETSRRETASVVLQAILAHGVKGGYGFFGESVEAIVVAAKFEGPDATVGTLKQLLATGTDLLGGYQVPGDAILIKDLKSTTALARALLEHDSVVVGERDLIELLKYPSCAGDVRAAVLARLGTTLGHPLPYKSVWALLNDLRLNHHELYEFAKATVVRPRNPSPQPAPAVLRDPRGTIRGRT